MTALRKSFDRDLMLSFNGNMLYYASETPDGFLRPGRKSLDDEHLLEQLYRESDIIDLHAPMSEENEHIERLSDPRITICNIYYNE